MEGFYKFDGENWLYAPNFVYAKDYVLEKDGNREEVDGWKWILVSCFLMSVTQ